MQDNGSRVIIPLADRDYLINNFSKWKPQEKAFLASQDALIDFTPYTKILSECIERIHDKTMRVHLKEDFYVSCAKLICIANEFANEDDVAIIATKKPLSEKVESKKKLNITMLLVSCSKTMLKSDIVLKRDKTLILYSGKSYENRLKEVGIEILSNDIIMKLTKSEFVELYGRKMIRANMQLKFDTKDSYFVLVNRNLGYRIIKEISELYQLYLKALLKE